MEKKTKKIIIKVLIAICVVAFIALIIYTIVTVNKINNRREKEGILSYLNETYKNTKIPSNSPIYGFLNYNFESIDSNPSIDELINTNITINSKMNSVGVDNIYKSVYGVSKSNYVNNPRYISNPKTNCYYYQNKLNKKEFNCDEVCSMSTGNIMNEIKRRLKWINILPSDAQKYCVKNALYPIEEEGYFININDMKKIFKKITNLDLNLNKAIKNNEYYNYGSYLVTKTSNIKNKIVQVKSIEDVSKKDDIYTAEYIALNNKNNELKGTVKLKKLDESYYIVANNIETGYNLN